MSVIIVIIGIFTRLIPHFPNFSPEIVFALYLGMKHSKRVALFAIVLMAIISDILLGFGIGYWAIFTYSALLVIGWIGTYIKSHQYGLVFIIQSAMVTVGYWVWTNFGTWLMTNMYAQTLAGLMKCYVLALPFLTNSLGASFAWCAIIVFCENYLVKKSAIEAV